MFDDGQPEAQSSIAAGDRAVRLMKAIEDVRQGIWPDARAIVGDRDFDLTLGAAKRDRNVAALRRELDGIGEQIPDHLLNPRRIPRDRPGRFQRGLDDDPFRLGFLPQRLDGIPDDRLDVDALDIELQLAGDDPADIHQIGNQLRLQPRIARHDAETAIENGRIVAASHHELRPRQNRVQRRSQLVGDHRHKVVFHAARSFRLGTGDALGLEQPLAFRGGGLPLGDVAGNLRDADDDARVIEDR